LDPLQTLKRVPLFADLTDTELRFLAQRSVHRHYAESEVIFHEGQPCTGLYVVQAGNVRIFSTSANGREQVLAIEGPGSSIAELPVFDGGNYPASTAAVTDLDLLFISKQDFHSLCLVHPKVALKVLRVVGRRLRGLVHLIEELSFSTVRARLLAMLLRLAREQNQAGDTVEIVLPANQQELAAQLGTVRELISRNLSRLQAEGIIQIEGRTIRIPSYKALEAQIEPLK